MVKRHHNHPFLKNGSCRAQATTLLAELGPICSWNTRGLFASQPALRRSKLGVANFLGQLSKIIVLQETHGEASDWAHGLLPGYAKFVSAHPASRGKARVIIAVDKELIRDRPHDWDHTHQGRIARLRLPSPSIADAIVSIYSIHLEGESNSHQEQLSLPLSSAPFGMMSQI